MEEIKLSITLPVSAEKLYKSWLSSDIHTAFTGGDANIKAIHGAPFTAWDGYISGKNVELIKNKFIKQAWRTLEFDSAWPDSIVELKLVQKKDKTTLYLHHYNLQKGNAIKYKIGWKEHYFEPMKRYFKAQSTSRLKKP